MKSGALSIFSCKTVRDSSRWSKGLGAEVRIPVTVSEHLVTPPAPTYLAALGNAHTVPSVTRPKEAAAEGLAPRGAGRPPPSVGQSLDQAWLLTARPSRAELQHSKRRASKVQGPSSTRLGA